MERRTSRSLLLAAALASALAVAGSAAAVAFSDATGDSSTAPDIAALDVTNDARGRITLRLTLANRSATLEATDVVYVFLNTDRSEATGAAGGDDFALRLTPGAFAILAWDGERFTPSSVPAATASLSAGVVTFVLPRSALGNTAGFDAIVFGAHVEPGPTVRAVDIAPDSGRWSYTLTRFCVVPRVTGKTLASARSALAKAGCRVGTVARRASPAKKGRVVAQAPRVGTTRARGARVNLVLSRGRTP